MTVISQDSVATFEGNGIATEFSFNFRFFKDSDLKLTVTDPEGNSEPLTTGYTIQGAGNAEGGSVTLAAPLQLAYELRVERMLPVNQMTDLRNQGRFFAEVHEDTFDRIVMLIQQAFSGIFQTETDLRGTVRGPNRETMAAMPRALQRVGKLLSFDSSGNPVVIAPAFDSSTALRLDLANPEKGPAELARGVIAVDSIADLLALPEHQRRVDLRYIVKGYHAGSDVGGGEFYWDPSRLEEDDGGSVRNGFVRVVGDYVDFEMFGAMGGGEVDDALSIQKALDFNAPIIPRAREYLASRCLHIPTGTRLVGREGAKILFSGDIEEDTLVSIDGAHGVEISDLAIEVASSIPTTQFAVHVNNSNKVSITNCTVDGGSQYDEGAGTMVGGINQGIHFHSSSQCSVTRSAVMNFRTSHCVSTLLSDGIVVEGNRLLNSKRAGVSIGRGTTNCSVLNNTLKNNQRNHNFDGAIDIYGYLPHCEDITIEGNVISDVGDGDSGNVTESQNKCIRIKDAKRVKVSKNILIVNKPLWGAIEFMDRDFEAPLEGIDISKNTIVIMDRMRYIMHGLKSVDGEAKTISIRNNCVVSEVPYYEDGGMYDFCRFRFSGGINGLFFEGNTVDLPNERYSDSNNMLFDFPGLSGSKGVVIRGNTFKTNKRLIDAVNVEDIVLSGNVIESRVWGAVIRLMSGVEGVIVESNIIKGRSAAGKISITTEDKILSGNMEKQYID